MIRSLLTAALVVGLSVSVKADIIDESQWEYPPMERTMRDLVNDGHEIRSVNTIMRAYGKGTRVTTIYHLQKGTSVYKCWEIDNSEIDSKAFVERCQTLGHPKRNTIVTNGR